MTTAARPESFVRRSPLVTAHETLGAQFAALDAALVVDHYGDPTTEAGHLRQLGLVDLCTLPRSGCKGRGTPAQLEQAGLQLPESPNLARRQSGGALVARLSNDEFLLLPDPCDPGARGARLPETLALQRGCYPLPRADSHGWLLLGGTLAAPSLSKLCAVDLRPQRFANLTIAQTSLARINAIVIRADLGNTPAYHLLADISVTCYLWDCLVDAMAEHDGHPVGWAALAAHKPA